MEFAGGCSVFVGFEGDADSFASDGVNRHMGFKRFDEILEKRIAERT